MVLLRLLSLAIIGVVFVTGLVWWAVLAANVAVGFVRRLAAPRPPSPFDDGPGFGYPRGGDRPRHA